MVFRHHHAAVPAIAGHHQQVVEQVHTLGGDGKVHGPVGCHLGDLHGRTLVHMQRHIRILFNKAADHRRQSVACLGMGGGNTEVALALVAELLGNFFDALYPAQDFSRLANDNLAARSDAGQVLAAAGKYFQPQLVFQQADLLGNPRLRGKQALGGGGHIQIVVRNFPDIPQLL